MNQELPTVETAVDTCSEQQPQATAAALSLPAPLIPHGWLRALVGSAALFILLIGVSVLIGIVLVVISMAGGELNPEALERMTDPAQISLPLLFALQVCQLLCTLVLVWLLRRFVDRRPVAALGLRLRGFGLHLLEGSLWGAGLIVAAFIILLAAGMLIIDPEHVAITIGSFLGYCCVLVVVAANEELMIRGYVLSNLMLSLNRWVALLVSATVFAAFHLLNANLSPLSLLNLVLAGVVLGVYYVHRRNLWFSFGMHLAWNLFQGPVLGFQVSGLSTASIIGHKLEGPEAVTGGSFGLEGSVLTTGLLIVTILVIHYRFRSNAAKPQPKPDGEV